MSLLSKTLELCRTGDATAAPYGFQSPDLKATVTQVRIDCPARTDEDAARDRFRLRGQFLARQERWQELVAEVLEADRLRRMTPAGMPVAELLCFGARADVVAAVEHALVDGRPTRGAPLVAGIEALEETLAEMPDDPTLTAIVAQAHMDLGWAWRGSDWHSEIPAQNLDAFEAHFDRARDILAPYAKSPAESPLIAATLCNLDASGIESSTVLAHSYAQLIDLNPKCPGPMRALGNYLSPRWYGTHAELELAARRTAARTQDHWGAGGYTWVMFDTLAGDPLACAHLDLDFFVEGLADILVHAPDQHTTNTLAAFCGVTMSRAACGIPEADRARNAITGCFDWVVRNYLTEIHPLVWAHAAAGFDNGLRVPSARTFAASGHQNALCKIAELFLAEIAAGNRIVFTADGPIAEHC